MYKVELSYLDQKASYYGSTRNAEAVRAIREHIEREDATIRARVLAHNGVSGGDEAQAAEAESGEAA